jgi:DNA replication and repair protein RecF
MGKTNVLDALYYLCLGKSYFSSGDRYVIKQDEDFFRLEGDFEVDSDREVVVIKCQTGNRKEIEVSGKKCLKISDHVGSFLCVMIAPADIQTMLDGSEERRNFLNNTIVQTDRAYLEDLILYGGLLKRRNVLLKSFLEQKRFDAILLESLTEPMISPAERIYQKRIEQVNQMAEIFSQTYAEISGEKEDCKIEYQSQLNDSSLEKLMDDNLAKDRILGRTTQGIHKDDLNFSMNGESLKNFASQGQLKSFVLSLKLTQYKLLEKNAQKKPILLLDDIFDKLDQTRVKHLLGLLKDNEYGQVFITDTNEDRILKTFKDIQTDYHIFTVENGNVFHKIEQN